MMLSFETTSSSMFDQSMATNNKKNNHTAYAAAALPGNNRRSTSDPTTTHTHMWALRRWSLRGTKDTGAGLGSSHNKQAPITPTPTATQCPTSSLDCDNDKRKRSRSVDMSPLHHHSHTSLKKAPSGISAKITQCVEALGLREALHRYKHHHHGHSHHHDHHDHHSNEANNNTKERHVHFPSTATALCQSIDRPETTPQEKLHYHYTKQELMGMVLDAKECLVRETRFCSQPENTIFEQGFLTFPNEKHFFHHHKRYYCLLKSKSELFGYASPAHAASNTQLKWKMSLIKVQECSSMPMQAKIGAFGAHLPATISLLFFVTKCDGQKILISAECKSHKKSWVHTLQKLTQVHEVPTTTTAAAAVGGGLVRQSSTASTCNSEDDSDFSSVSSSSSSYSSYQEEEETRGFCGGGSPEMDCGSNTCKKEGPLRVVDEDNNIELRSEL